MNTTATIGSLIERTGVEVLDYLDRQVEIPVLDGLQAQGDVMVVPASFTTKTKAATALVPKQGIAVVRGEAGGNTHLLLAEEGDVFFDASTATVTSLALGTLTVPDGSVALLAHPEHAFSRIAPGTYQIRRQREQADELRIVAD